ncbi:hypothetical protein AZE42_05278 [Rhizopogon vesiculosus]|uniref:Replication factor C subunit 3 n=1 Tax=Rhizopogon vesiculosus TaxID=180088 RepID=A0A1J8PHD6_9AGAM|nr:hypothetical protein AZE42_05278 [Rhizopogon vesiculosus]
MDNGSQMDVDTIPSSSKGKGKANAAGNEPHQDETLPWLRFPPSPSVPLLTYLTGWRSIDQSPWTMLFPIRTLQRQVEFLLNASDDRGIDVVREQIKQFAETRTLFSKGFKLIILDEADMMTQQAQAALRRVIEQYTKNVRFCIICNYVNKIAPAIQSRCTRFRFSPLPIVEVEKRVNDVVAAENVNLTEDGKKALLKLSKGDMRRALNVLQACHAAYTSIGETEIYNCTGNPHPSDIETIVNSMLSDEFTTSYQMILAMKTERGLALQDLISGTYEYVETIEFKPQARVYLLDFLSTTEHRLSAGGSEKMQLSALLGAFKNAVELSAK